jgi:radical SAM superfamily enzyme YgiQ (UPF0313 family)
LYKNYATQPQTAVMVGKRAMLSPLALAIVAGLTPPRYSIRIVDEQLEEIPAGLTPGLVGITSLTNTSIRAFELADRYRAAGAKVVLGGPHASFAVEDCLEHADAVVVGEVEPVWERVLADYERGTLGGAYKTDVPYEFKTLPRPRWDLVRTDRIMSIPVEFSRGCPYSCEFCSAHKIFGHKMRYRDVDDIIDEIKSLPIHNLFFVDDNLTMGRARARELMEKLKPLRVSWTCLASIDIGRDKPMLELMADAGCMHIIVGFESLNENSLEATKKHHNQTEGYKEAISNIQAASIVVMASFVVGFDHDTLDECAKIEQFALDAPLPYIVISPLSCTPGTDLQERLVREGRWHGWMGDHEIGVFPQFDYVNFTSREVFRTFIETAHRMYSYEQIARRVLKMLSNGAFSRSRPGSRDYSAFFKAKVLLKVLWTFLVTSDRDKRKLFLTLAGKVRRGELSADRVIPVLIAMEGYHRHLPILRSYLPKLG